MKRAKTTGYLRAMLLQTIEEVRAGTIDSATANNVAKLAGRLNESIAVEAKLGLVMLASGAKPPEPGNLAVGEGGETPFLELSDEDLGRHVRELARVVSKHRERRDDDHPTP